MKAISLWQPWASAIAAGLKTIETRSWPTAYRGPIAIHASKRWSRDQKQLFMSFHYRFPEFKERMGWIGALPKGAIVATALLMHCVEIKDALASAAIHANIGELEWSLGDYGPGRFAWVLAHIKALRVPVPCIGRQGFFEVEIETPDHV